MAKLCPHSCWMTRFFLSYPFCLAKCKQSCRMLRGITLFEKQMSTKAEGCKSCREVLFEKAIFTYEKSIFLYTVPSLKWSRVHRHLFLSQYCTKSVVFQRWVEKQETFPVYYRFFAAKCYTTDIILVDMPALVSIFLALLISTGKAFFSSLLSL